MGGVNFSVPIVLDKPAIGVWITLICRQGIGVYLSTVPKKLDKKEFRN